VIYAARNRRWGEAVRQQNRAALGDFAARLRAVNVARGETLPIDETLFLSLVLIVGRGVIQELTVDPQSIAVADVEAMFVSLAGGSGAP